METLKFGSDYQNCAHSFAYADKNGRGENYGNRMFYENDTIYSYGYHFIIAKKIRNKSGDIDFILFNAGSASNTTSKQQLTVKNALYHTLIETHSEITNFNALTEVKAKERVMIETADSYSRARAEHVKNDYLATIHRELKDISFLVERYRIKSKTPNRILNYLNFSEDTDGLLQALTKGKVARKASIKRENTMKEQRRLAQIEKDKKKEAVKLQEWKEGKHARIYTRYAKNDCLRISADGSEVQTSQGVSIPIDEAKRLLRLIDAKKIIGAKIDEKFTVTAFNGLMKVGCHNISIEEINEVRAKLEVATS